MSRPQDGLEGVYHMRVTMMLSIAAISLSAASSSHAGDGVLLVDDDAPLGGDGLSWDTAYRFLQDALADVPPGVIEIRVAQDTYTPDRDEAGNVTPGDREATFQLFNTVAVRGGRAGIGAPDPTRATSSSS